MSYQRTINPSDAVSQPACVFLRSKAMYVTGQLDPTHVDEAGSHYCWCNLTQHILGPDDNPVERRACISGRDCYRATRSLLASQSCCTLFFDGCGPLRATCIGC